MSPRTSRSRSSSHATVERFGAVDILANAAGITAEQTIVGHSDALWDKVIDVNLTGTYRAIKQGATGDDRAQMGADHQHRLHSRHGGSRDLGCLLRLQSSSGRSDPVVALEGAPHGVTCNSISPTWVDTSFGREWMTDIAEKQEHRSGDEYIADVEKSNPQGRLISPTEIGALAFFLCSEAANGITMEDLRVSAGSLW